MRAAAELSVAAIVAVGLHVAAFALTHPDDGFATGGGGAGGVDRVSVQAADAGIAALVAAWDAPPVIAPVADLAPPVPVLMPDLPALTGTPPLPQAVTLPDPPRAVGPPAVQDVPPPVDQAQPVSTLRPQRRPENPAPPEKPAEQPQAEKPQAPRPASDGSRQATVAAGDAGSAAAGAGQGDTAGQAGDASARAAWMGAIRSRIERNMRYPRDGNGAKGTVLVQVAVAADGALVAVGIAESSGIAALDQAAIVIVRKAAPFRRAPRDAGTEAARFNVPLTFRP